jgi:hypothetical protein
LTELVVIKRIGKQEESLSEEKAAGKCSLVLLHILSQGMLLQRWPGLGGRDQKTRNGSFLNLSCLLYQGQS